MYNEHLFSEEVMDLDSPNDAEKGSAFSLPQVFMYTAQSFI